MANFVWFIYNLITKANQNFFTHCFPLVSRLKTKGLETRYGQHPAGRYVSCFDMMIPMNSFG